MTPPLTMSLNGEQPKMNTHHRTIGVAIAALLLAATLAIAHGNLEHIAGTVTKISNNSVTVTTTAGKAIDVALDTDTTFSKAGKTILKTDIKVGDRIVIHAEKEDGKLSAHTVEIGAAKAAH